MSKGARKPKGLVDKSSTTDKIVTSKTGSWIGDLQAKQDAETAPQKVDNKPVVAKRTRKAPKYRQSHHQGQGKLSNTVCVSKDGGKTAIKMHRLEADKLVKAGLAQYASKTLWRASNRDTVEAPKVAETDPVVVRKNRRAKNKTK